MLDFDEILEFDIESVLQNTENDECIILQKLFSACSEFRSKILCFYEEYLLREKEFVLKSNSYTESIFEINTQIKNAEKKLDEVLLNQKVADREISNIIKQQEKLQEHLKQIREQRERTSLEIVDLQHEMEERKKEKKQDWDAIKRACFIYKDKLDIRLVLNTSDDIENVTIMFFVKQHQDKYYVTLTHKDNVWKVDKIEPDLKLKHRNELKKVMDFTNNFQVKNITAFLCQLRYIFLKYYCKE